MTSNYVFRAFGLFSFVLLTALGASGCLRDECEATRTFRYWKPIYALIEDFRKPIAVEGAREMCEPGQLYYYQDYLFVAEPGEGVHIINNQDPAAPAVVAFLPIQGAEDMAIVNDYLYVNNYIDLVVFRLNTPATPEYAGRLEEAFPFHGQYDPGLGYLVEWQETNETMQLPCSDPNSNQDWFWWGGGVLVDVAFDINIATVNTLESSSNGSIRGAGIGGSLARFTIAKNNLYVVDNTSLRVFSLSDPVAPQRQQSIPIGWGIETIFPYGDNLFIGSQSGMFIFDNSNPLAPVQIGVFEHARACDPVFATGNRAYVTLRDGTTCQNFINQLDVVDISDLRNPRLIRTHPMHRPIGLSLVDDRLFLCDDDQGLKLFDASDDHLIGQRLLDRAANFQARDVIALPQRQVAIVIGPDGLRQFDFSQTDKLLPLSHLPVCR